MIPDRTETSGLLDEALAGVAVAFQGMTAHEQESNCECHWGSAEELALLKTPDVPLDEELLRRTYWAADWHYPGLLLRRILPQVTERLVDGRIVAMEGLDSLARFFAVSPWHEWPKGQQAALRRFLNVWWVHVLVEPDAKVPAHAALPFLAEATTRLTPWLADWAEALVDEPARRHLVEAMDEWMYDLQGDALPWPSSHDIDALGPRAATVGDTARACRPARARRVGGADRGHQPVQPARFQAVRQTALALARRAPVA